MVNHFKEKWDEIENCKTLPRSYSGNTIVMEYEELQNMVLSQNMDFINCIVESLYSGDVYIFKNSYNQRYLIDLKEKVFEYRTESPSAYYKMVEDTPDFHRIIDKDVSKNYPYDVIKHAFYFYNWNSDPFKLYPTIYEKWRIFKFLSGYEMREYENNTPIDGIIDRIQIVQYPAGGGMLGPHSDPYKYQKLAFGCMMTKKGVDYKQGGFYVVDKNENKINIEEKLDVGDYAVVFCTVIHGVDIIDPDTKLNWDSINGRWFLSTFSNESNYTPDSKRHTAYSVELKKETV